MSDIAMRNVTVSPLPWVVKGSHLHTATAAGLTYCVFGSPLWYRATVAGEELYAGDDLDAAKRALQDYHDRLIRTLIEVDDSREVARLKREISTLKSRAAKQRYEITRMSQKLEVVTEQKSRLLDDIKWMRGEHH